MTDETSSHVATEHGGLLAIRSIARLICEPNFPSRGKKTKALFRHKTAELLDRLYRDLMQQAGVKQLFECGAHEARTSIDFVRRHGGNAVAIEANPSIYEEKTQKAQRHGVTTLNLALSDKEEELPFYVPLDARIAGSASLRTKADHQHVAVMVQARTLDQIVGAHRLPNTLFSLWIDVEGMAFEVLTGGKKTLAHEYCGLIKIDVASRVIVGSLDKQIGTLSVPVLHGLNRCPGLQR